ncbi:unnamed protein product [Owenia fusiformis]|uniref:EGF-like domain-containing protein n=1 Tax=Owenia fusiformis TaxID=6347 RepID=A0A8S4N1H6_OWEFU|nr:unnamed protein product [Owenia fusiformis]
MSTQSPTTMTTQGSTTSTEMSTQDPITSTKLSTEGPKVTTECARSQCQHNGTCYGDATRFTCNCTSSYRGDFCEIEINECRSSPCLNRGTCVDQLGMFICRCLVGFTGTLCETDMDDCFADTCLNNGTCVDFPNNFRCDCNGNYTGRRCDQENIYRPPKYEHFEADDRPSAKIIGSMGLVIIGIFIGGVIFLDSTSLIREISRMLKNIKRMCFKKSPSKKTLMENTTAEVEVMESESVAEVS